MTSTRPLNQAQKPAAASRGKASERAPTCSGTAATAMPRSSGTSTPKTRAMRKATNICGSAPASNSVSPPSIRSAPSITPSTAAPTRATSEQPMKLRPMTFESLDVSHEARAATAPPLASSATAPAGTSATVSGAMSVVLIGAADITGPASGGSEIAREPSTSSVNAANSNVTYVMLYVNTRMLAAGVGLRARATVAPRNPAPSTTAATP